MMTWNMQGAGSSGRPRLKWEVLGNLLATDPNPPDVVALQECGNVRDNGLPGQYQLQRTLNGNGWDVLVYAWRAAAQASPAYRDCFVSYVFLDYGSHRVNLSLVTTEEPDGAATTFAELRPALGVWLDDEEEWYFSVHASAAGGWDAADIMANIWTTVGCGPWAALGDWNAEPNRVPWNGEDLAQLTDECGLGHVDCGRPTHPRPGSGSTSPPRNLDWAAHTDGIAVPPAARVDMGCSDHYAVRFQ